MNTSDPDSRHYNELKLSHKRTSRAGLAIFAVGLFIFILGLGEIMVAGYLMLTDKSKVNSSLKY
jgi:hypothetical protein